MQDHGLAWHAGKYVLYSPQKNHFFGAEVFEDGSAAVFLSHKRHICLTFSATDMGTVARDWRVFRVEQGLRRAARRRCRGRKWGASHGGHAVC